MRILIADDHAVVRKGLRQILTEEYPDAQFEEAASTAVTLDRVSRSRWDLLILDIFMPGRTGLEVLREARRLRPQLPVLVVSSAPEEQMAVRVLKAGARGYLNKAMAAEELVRAVGRLLAGGRYVGEALAELLAAEFSQSARSPKGRLSDREFAVLHLLLAGRSIKEIAAELSLSGKTVSTYHTRIWEKFGVRNNIDLLRCAVEHGLCGSRVP